MQAKLARIFGLLVLGLLVAAAFWVTGCGGGNGGTPQPPDIVDPDVPGPAQPIFTGRIDLVPEVEVRFVDRNLRSERLSDNPLSEDPIFEAIGQATRSLDIAVLRINRQEFVEALLRQSETVKIRIVTEKFYYDSPIYKPFYEQLEDPTKNHGNIEIRTDNEGSPRMMHARFIIIDGARTVVGSYDWAASGARNTIGDFVILKDSRIAAAFRNQFEQMFTERLFGNEKRNVTQHTWQVGGGYGRVDVYFGPTDDLRSRIQTEIEASTNIAFNVKEFADIDLANFILNWSLGANRWSGEGRNMIALINDIGIQTTPEEQAIYRALIGRIVGNADVQGNESLTDSSINSSNPFPVTVSNHKFIVCDRDEVSQGVDPPSVITGSANWTGSSFDFNDEVIVVLTGAPVVGKYTGYIVPFAPDWRAYGTDIRPEDFGELTANYLAYPNAVSPGGALEVHQVPFAAVYGSISNFKREVLLGVGDGTTPPPSMQVDVVFQISGKTYLDKLDYMGFNIDNFDVSEVFNPNKMYIIFVPAGEVTISPILTDSGGTPIPGANNPTYKLDVGPGGVRRLDMSVGSPPADTGGGSGGGGGGGGSGGGT